MTIPPTEILAKARVSNNVRDHQSEYNVSLCRTAELRFLQPNQESEVRNVTSTPDDAELLKDLRGLGKPQSFDENDTDASFFPVSEDDSILLRQHVFSRNVRRSTGVIFVQTLILCSILARS